MDESTSIPPSLGQRTLAVIVFTDVVDFSTRVGQDEEATLTLVRRDLETMGDLCKGCGGYVLKNTGDGLLMYFNSAVQAVQCAMDIQIKLAEKGRDVWPAEPLQHRIGIHLGDVFVNGGDVLGDGVNIASRLESQAAPGGICLSQTVYDVVRNKLNFQAQCLGPRQLKHIADPVTIYHIGKTLPASAVTPTQTAATGSNRSIWIMAGIAILLFLAATMVLKTKHPDTAKTASGRLAKRQQIIAQNQSAAPATSTVNNPVSLTPEDVAEARKRFLPGYNFTGMVDWLKKNGVTEQSIIGGGALKRFGKMATLRAWMESTLQKYSEQNPLVMPVPQTNPPQKWTCWGLPQEQIMFKSATGQVSAKALSDIKPSTFGMLARSLMQDQYAKGGAVATIDLMEAARIFSQEYRLHSQEQAQ